MIVLNRLSRIVALGAVVAATPSLALTWNNQGHMAVGEIAYNELASSHPDVVREIVGNADALPRRSLLDTALKGVAGAERDRLTFAFLARWPDDIRGTEQDRPDHHYRLRGVSDFGAILPLRGGHADSEVAHDLAVIKNRAVTARDRAIALAWLFHVEGDMHQPLHAGTWLSWTFPKSDRAGTIAYVRRAPSAELDTLHNFWDGAVDRPGLEINASRALAVDLRRKFPRSGLIELRARSDDFNVWADESAVLARKIAYQNGALRLSPTPVGATVLSPHYVAVARALSERRVATAGYRLADILAEARSRSPSDGLRSAPP